MNIFEELKSRGLIFQTTDEEALEKALTEGQISYYSGYDPTADSLHNEFFKDSFSRKEKVLV